MTDSVREAQLKMTDAGLIPQGEGWFILNARDVSWIRSDERGQDTDFEGGQEWAQLGFRIHVLMPGQRNGMYHRERGQEDFLVVAGECVLVMTGSRAGGFEVVYPVNEVAAKHGASVLEETSKPDEAYAPFGPEERSAYHDGWLPRREREGQIRRSQQG